MMRLFKKLDVSTDCDRESLIQSVRERGLRRSLCIGMKFTCLGSGNFGGGELQSGAARGSAAKAKRYTGNVGG